MVIPHRLSFPVIIFLILLNAGCQSTGVKPWEKDILSRPEMQFQTRDLDLVLDEHFYFSKEGIGGGRGFSGGGCGCN